MKLPPEAINEFQEIFYQERGVWLSDEDAHRLAHELFTLGKTLVEVAKPVPESAEPSWANADSQSTKPKRTAA